ncbi:MAG: ACP S-malonyltransferase [Deltaproteobacteria bacterium]|nr:ACP S-malonyltransferase [Deltaproteobacteria bacterium]
MLSFVFPGQGSQSVGMAKAVVGQSPAARRIFEEANTALGFDLMALCFNGPESELQLTTNSQPAILCASVALLRALEDRTGLTPSVVAGHSLGEYTALVCAGAFAFADAIRIVRLRGQLMQEAVPPGVGSMAAIGAAGDVADALCRDAAQGQVLSPANYNSPSQTVIAGHTAAVQRAVKLATDRRIAAKELKVSAPFHCALMQPAADKLKDALAKVTLQDAKIPVISNVDAVAYQRANEARERLTKQVTAPVRWEMITRKLGDMGVKALIEVGPGKVLTGLTRKIRQDIAAASCETPADLDALAARAELQAYKSGTQATAKAAPRALKDWADMTKDERDQAITELVEFDKVLAQLEAKPHDIYRWISVNKLPTWLVDGELKFHPVQLDAWLGTIGGIAALKAKEAAEAAALAAEAQTADAKHAK